MVKWIDIVVVAVLYIATAKLGQLLAVPPGNITPVWIPSGIILAAVLIRGYHVWPGIFIGAFVGNVWAYFNFESGTTIMLSIFAGAANGFGDMLCAVIGAYLIIWSTKTRYPLNRAEDTVKFIFYGAIVGSLVSALLGVASLNIAGFIPWNDFGYILATWWTGDAVGVIILTPIFLSWINNQKKLRFGIEELIFLFLLLFTGAFCFEILNFSLPFKLPLFIILPLLMWSAFRLDQRITYMAILLISIMAILVTALGHGRFSDQEINQALIELQLFIVFMAITILILRAVIAERQKARNSLQIEHDDLERRVDERTAELYESEERSRILVENAPEAIVVMDMDQQCFVDVNGKTEKLFILSKNDLLSMNPADISPPVQPDGRPSMEVVQEKLQLAMQNKMPVFEWVHRNSKGIDFLCEIRLVRLPSKNKRLVRGSITDISERKQIENERINLEKQVQHAQKLESLGVLAGGIAHDFNNLLMVIVGNVDLALLTMPSQTPGRKHLLEIEKASERAAGLAKQMLAYSGKGKFTIETINLNEFVLEMGHLLEVSISKKASLIYNFAADLPSFDGDATQIRQIIMNLITNASEAIGDMSGEIHLITGVMDCSQAFLESTNSELQVGLNKPLLEGKYIYIEVKDTGCGMDAETQAKIFNPFFTTKFTGRGLGMAAVMGIVRGHLGAIKLESKESEGTVFKVFFPVKSELRKNEMDKSEEEDHKIWCGSGTILIVDDEETVRAVGKLMVERMGFSVLLASDGKEALDVFAEHHNEIDCVLLDFTMPFLNGDQVFMEMREIQPEVKVILCSGYNEHPAIEQFVSKELAGFIQKPYKSIDLELKLKEIFDI